MNGVPSGFKPMLAATHTKAALLRFPLYASPKIDGVRCVIFDGVAYSRTLKPIPNPFVQEWAKANGPDFLNYMDGELVVGPATAPNVMQATTSGVMSKKGAPDFSFHAFDLVRITGLSFGSRFEDLDTRFATGPGVHGADPARVWVVPHKLIRNHEELTHFEHECLALGYEGVMLRDPEGGYKFGRSTEREGGLVKLKRFSDAEAEIVGYVEEMHNANEATRDALGNTERSTAKAGLVGKGTLGAWVVRYSDDPDGTEFSIGTGLTAAQRADFWVRRHELLGALVKFKFFDHGIKEAPRHPVFLGFRAKEDA